MNAMCKMTHEQTTWPCPSPSCPLYGDCLAEWQKHYVKSLTNIDRILSMSDAEKRQALIDYFCEWAGIGDSFIFDLTRVKEAFAIGTMSFDDFVEWDEERIAMLVDEFLDWLQQPAEGAQV